ISRVFAGRPVRAPPKPFFVFAAVCFILGLLAWAFYFMRVAHVESAVVDSLQPELTRMRGFDTQLNQLRRETAALDQAATPLLGTISDRGAWLRILDDLKV